MFDLKKYLAENREIVEGDPAVGNLDHQLRKKVTDFVWKPDSRKKQQIVSLLNQYLENWKR